MNYTIKGEPFPVAICELQSGESLISESGAMGWMTDNFDMDTNLKGGLFGGISRAFSGESVFLNTYRCLHGTGKIAFPASLPGKIVAKTLLPNEDIICQKGAFLAATPSVSLKIDFRKRLSSGFFGGEGFILQRITGPGLVFLEFDGYVEEYNLLPGEKLKVDTGNVAMFDSSVSYDVELIKGFKNMFFGGEGLFLTTLVGPGKVYLQSMPAQTLAANLSRFFSTNNSQ